MNNEEKILSLLETLTTDVSELKTDMSGVKTDMAEVKVRLNNVEETLFETNERVRGLEQSVASIEYNHGKRLDLIYETVQSHTEALIRIKEDVKRHDDILLQPV